MLQAGVTTTKRRLHPPSCAVQHEVTLSTLHDIPLSAVPANGHWCTPAAITPTSTAYSGIRGDTCLLFTKPVNAAITAT
jgi:hypothetical protein